MSETIIIIIASVLFGIIGFLIGKHISKLQNTSELSGVNERNFILEKQLNDVKQSCKPRKYKKLEDSFTGTIELHLKEQLYKTDQEKELIRKAKDVATTIELTKLEADYNNLQIEE